MNTDANSEAIREEKKCRNALMKIDSQSTTCAYIYAENTYHVSV
jgi:hypothetical protein